MKKINISLLESIYLIYMFLFFQTTMDFNILSSPNGWWFEHLTGNEYGKRICPFGRVAIFALIFILILRNIINIPRYFIKISLFISFILSLMNLNAVVYLVPIWIYEYYN